MYKEEIIPTIVQLSTSYRDVLIEAIDRAIVAEKHEESKSSEFNAQYIVYHKNKRRELEYMRKILLQYDGCEFTRG